MIQDRDTVLRQCICIEHCVAIILWCLATCREPLGTCLVLPGVQCVIVHQTCCTIADTLLTQNIQFPRMNFLCKSWLDSSQTGTLYSVLGAIDPCQIQVKPPELNHTDYYNRKGWYSAIVQGVVGHDYLFCIINLGWPDSVHEARVLADFVLYQQAMQGENLADEAISTQCTVKTREKRYKYWVIPYPFT